MKPHSMFFDENYTEHYYRSDTVCAMLKKTDCLIVVGTALETNFAKKIVHDVLKAENPVIEINLESCISAGHVYQVIEKSEIALPALFNEYYNPSAQK